MPNILHPEIQSFLLSFDCFTTFNEPEITVWLLCIRLQQRSIERAMDLTDSFTWEDLPTRDAETGQLSAAGWIPLTMKYSRNVAVAMLCFHFVQSTIRIVTNHETLLIAWYPFDWTVSPFYELVNISQVTIYKTEFSYISFYSTLNLTDLFKWHTSFSFLSFYPLPFLNFLRWSPTTGRLSVGWQWVIGKKSLKLTPSNPGTKLDFICRSGRKRENFGISGVSAGTQWIQFNSATAAQAVQISGRVFTWSNVSCLARIIVSDKSSETDQVIHQGQTWDSR